VVVGLQVMAVHEGSHVNDLSPYTGELIDCGFELFPSFFAHRSSFVLPPSFTLRSCSSIYLLPSFNLPLPGNGDDLLAFGLTFCDRQ
jgi:hypothetical protein